MTEKHRGGGAGRGCLNIIQQVNTVWWGSGGEGQARVPNGVKDIVSKISIFSYIYLYRTNNSLLTMQSKGMPFFRFS